MALLVSWTTVCAEANRVSEVVVRYHARGILRLMQGRRVEAMLDFTKSVELSDRWRPEIDRLLNSTLDK